MEQNGYYCVPDCPHFHIISQDFSEHYSCSPYTSFKKLDQHYFILT